MPTENRSSRRRRGRRRGAAKAIVPNPFVALLPSVKRDVDARLEAYFAEKLAEVAPYGGEVSAMLSALARFCLRGGKRVRPALAVVGFRVAEPKASLEAVLDAGLALELLHTYLLVHDDWMDEDALRRGGPTVHTTLAQRFKSEKLGAAAAILAGDLAASLALETFAKLPFPNGRAGALVECFAKMQEGAVLGQGLDVVGSGYDPEVAYALKTGSYTVRGPLRLGALLGGADARTLRALDRFAAPVGIAFQLADDLLSAFGSSAVTGKALGNDLRAGKRTSLLLTGLRRARGRDRRILKNVVGKAKASEAEVSRALAVLESSGARAAVEQRIEDLLKTALDALAGGVSRGGRELLEGAALALTSRRS
jgi:geranylgeranyl diphosphate synthase, type I